MFRERDEDSDLLIADFGLSRIIDTDKFHTLKTTCGTPGYMVCHLVSTIWERGILTPNMFRHPRSSRKLDMESQCKWILNRNGSMEPSLISFRISDLWAIGVITYFLLSGYTPFEGSNNVEEMQAIMNADYNYDDPCWDNISQAGMYFYKRKDVEG